MSIAPLIKSSVEKIPYPIGACIARLPYTMRPGIGRVYRTRKHELTLFNEIFFEAKANFIFSRMKPIVEHAFKHIDFYRKHYEQHGFNPSQLKSFEDLARIPIINKAQLQEYPIEKRSYPQPGRYLVNTGGSSGSPLGFYILPSSMGNEWAHMHHIWAKLGYRQQELKLYFAGRDIKNAAVCYDALRHHYAVNIYRTNHDIADALKRILPYRQVRYLHGYPSALYDFACYCESYDPELQYMLRKKLKGAFLGSEYPTPIYRNKIETVFKIPTVSWYGHTERAVLAWERNEPFIYHPFQTYGFAEAVLDSATNTTKLIGTSYYNTASPLIRYDTGDGIEVTETNGPILESFRIAGGREGNYVIDASGKKVSLTGLVFGRHHRIFDHAKFVQVGQLSPGQLTFYITPIDIGFNSEHIIKYFDLSGMDMSFDFVMLKKPVLTQSGKACLKIDVSKVCEYNDV